MTEQEQIPGFVEASPPSLAALTRASLRIGCLGFGGPAGQIALMHRIFVEEKRWIDETRYLHALNFCMILPGPEAQQLATYIGWLLRGVRGGVIAGALFVLPGAIIVFALSWLYAVYGQLPGVSAAFVGVKAAVLAFIVDALLRIGRRAVKTWRDAMPAALAFIALYLFGAPYPLIIVAAALYGGLVYHPPTEQPTIAAPAPPGAQSAQAALIWAGAWLAPVGATILFAGPEHVLSEVALLFSLLAIVTFGGAYAVLGYLQQQAVEAHGWLTQAAMIDALGLAETTPGPLILVNQFVAFLAGWNAPDGGLALAAAAAALASWCTFAPSFLWIFAGAPYAERIRRNRFFAGALRAVTAGVLGVIASLALWFGQYALFERQILWSTPWAHDLSLPDPGAFNTPAALIALAAGLALMRFKANPALVVLASALAGTLIA